LDVRVLAGAGQDGLLIWEEMNSRWSQGFERRDVGWEG